MRPLNDSVLTLLIRIKQSVSPRITLMPAECIFVKGFISCTFGTHLDNWSLSAVSQVDQVARRGFSDV
jgi:hypothetical protein